MKTRIFLALIGALISLPASAMTMTPYYSTYYSAVVTGSNTATVSMLLQGTTVCNPGPCPGQSDFFFHGNTVEVDGTYNTNTTGAGSYVNLVKSKDQTGDCRLPCKIKLGAGVACSIAGSLFTITIWVETEFTITRVSWTGRVFAPCNPWPGKCEFEVINWCTDATTPPDFDMNLYTVGDSPVNFPPVPGNPPYYWDVLGYCFRNTNPKGAWVCFPRGGAARYITPQPLLACTKKP